MPSLPSVPRSYNMPNIFCGGEHDTVCVEAEPVMLAVLNSPWVCCSVDVQLCSGLHSLSRFAMPKSGRRKHQQSLQLTAPLGSFIATIAHPGTIAGCPAGCCDATHFTLLADGAESLRGQNELREQSRFFFT